MMQFLDLFGRRKQATSVSTPSREDVADDASCSSQASFATAKSHLSNSNENKTPLGQAVREESSPPSTVTARSTTASSTSLAIQPRSATASLSLSTPMGLQPRKSARALGKALLHHSRGRKPKSNKKVRKSSSRSRSSSKQRGMKNPKQQQAESLAPVPAPPSSLESMISYPSPSLSDSLEQAYQYQESPLTSSPSYGFDQSNSSTISTIKTPDVTVGSTLTAVGAAVASMGLTPAIAGAASLSRKKSLPQMHITPLKSSKRYSFPAKVKAAVSKPSKSTTTAMALPLPMPTAASISRTNIDNSTDTSVRNAMQEVLNASDFANARRRHSIGDNSCSSASASSSANSFRSSEQDRKENGNQLQYKHHNQPSPSRDSHHDYYDYDTYKAPYQKIQTPEHTRRYLKQVQLKEEEREKKEQQKRALLPSTSPSTALTPRANSSHSNHSNIDNNSELSMNSHSMLSGMFSPVESVQHRHQQTTITTRTTTTMTSSAAAAAANTAPLTNILPPWNYRLSLSQPQLQPQPWEANPNIFNQNMQDLPLTEQRPLALATACLMARPEHTKRPNQQGNGAYSNTNHNFLLDDSLDADELALLAPQQPQGGNHRRLMYTANAHAQPQRRSSYASSTSASSASRVTGAGDRKPYDFAMLEGVAPKNNDYNKFEPHAHVSATNLSGFNESGDDLLPWAAKIGNNRKNNTNHQTSAPHARSGGVAIGRTANNNNSSFRAMACTSSLSMSRVSSIEGDSSVSSHHSLISVNHGNEGEGEREPSFSLWFGTTDGWIEQLEEKQARGGLNAVESAAETKDDEDVMQQPQGNELCLFAPSRHLQVLGGRTADESGIVANRTVSLGSESKLVDVSGIIASRAGADEENDTDSDSDEELDGMDTMLLQRKYQNQMQHRQLQKQQCQSELDDAVDAILLRRKRQNEQLAKEEIRDTLLLQRKRQNEELAKEETRDTLLLQRKRQNEELQETLVLQRKRQNELLAQEEVQDALLLQRKHENQLRAKALQDEESMDSQLMRRKYENQMRFKKMREEEQLDSDLLERKHSNQARAKEERGPVEEEEEEDEELMDNFEAKKAELQQMLMSPITVPTAQQKANEERDDAMDEQLLQRKREFQRDLQQERDDAEDEQLLQRKREFQRDLQQERDDAEDDVLLQRKRVNQDRAKALKVKQRLAMEQELLKEQQENFYSTQDQEEELDSSESDSDDEEEHDDIMLRRKHGLQSSTAFQQVHLRNLIQRLQDNTPLVETVESSSEDFYVTYDDSNKGALMVRTRMDEEGIVSGFASFSSRQELARQLSLLATKDGASEALTFVKGLVLSSSIHDTDTDRLWVETLDARIKLGLDETELLPGVLSQSLETTLSTVPTPSSTVTSSSSLSAHEVKQGGAQKRNIVLATSLLQRMSFALDELREWNGTQQEDAQSLDTICTRIKNCYQLLLLMNTSDVRAVNVLFEEAVKDSSTAANTNDPNDTSLQASHGGDFDLLQSPHAPVWIPDIGAAFTEDNTPAGRSSATGDKKRSTLLHEFSNERSTGNLSMLQSPNGPVWIPDIAKAFTDDQTIATNARNASFASGMSQTKPTYESVTVDILPKHEAAFDALSDEEMTNVQDMLYGDVSGSLSESDDYGDGLTESTGGVLSPTMLDSQKSVNSSTSSVVSTIQSEDLSGSLKENEVVSNGRFELSCSNTANEKGGYIPSLEITATQSKETVVEGLSPLGTLDGHFEDDVDENHSGSDNHREYATAGQKHVPTPKSANSKDKKSSPKSFMEGFLIRKKEKRTAPSARAVLGSI